MAFFFRKKQTPVTACIVPAAGQGTRMQGAYEETKQLISLCGVPLIVHTLEALEQAGEPGGGPSLGVLPGGRGLLLLLGPVRSGRGLL